MAGAPSIVSSTQILDIPPVVMEEFCRCMDCLSESEWMRFASHVASDLITLRSMQLLQKTGISVTRELLWSWGQRRTTVKDLKDILQNLKLYRALDILLQWTPPSPTTSEGRRETDASTREKNKELKSQVSSSSDAPQPLPSLLLPPPPPLDLTKSLQTNSDMDSVSPSQETLSIPMQECNLYEDTFCQRWTSGEVEKATEGFSSSKMIHSGEFADVFIGWKADKLYAIKRLKQEESEKKNRAHSYFNTETQIRSRCNHRNILFLDDFCSQGGPFCLIYKFMKNGSLDAALEKTGADTLSWEKRMNIAVGLLQAVGHLHNADILHGNIKSSNVFLDEDFSPKLGHSGLRFCPDRTAEYTQAKTKDIQKYNSYLPDSFLRTGLLTKQTDVFSCGVVLGEIMTGLKPYDHSRQPAYLKYLLIEEMDRVTGQVDSKSKQAEAESAASVCARHISQKYTDRRRGWLDESAALHFASAICLCLTKKKIDISEVYTVLEKAKKEFQRNTELTDSQLSPEKRVVSLNVPEEIDYDAYGSSEHSEDAMLEVTGSSRTPDSTDLQITRKQYSAAANHDSTRNPCEADESPTGDENVHSSLGGASSNYQPTSSTAGYQTTGHVKSRESQEHHGPCEASDTSFLSSGRSFPSWGIVVNDQKKKLMENIAMYEDERLDSSDMFDCS
ncbi:interleukin-1 receptor-associated kinase-like 2 [Spea bombifrons]|uniref:interleukin-1 receptor-associated kinase-like 2 n=1 Tax=Spea bombifrons TaxID=233779 RepID=UPI00234BB79C|nr:interleukin-1 receptor-associated kinase-like 2 [Spea bombifrons]